MTALEQKLCGLVAAIAMLVAVALLVLAYGRHEYAAGHATAVDERARVDAAAVLKRGADNAVKAVQQVQDNTTITKEKDDEIAALRARLAAAPRLRVGPAVCPDRPAPTADPQGAAGSNGPDPSAGVVSAAADADFKQLIEEVEQDLATGRACQAFLQKNGLVP